MIVEKNSDTVFSGPRDSSGEVPVDEYVLVIIDTGVGLLPRDTPEEWLILLGFDSPVAYGDTDPVQSSCRDIGKVLLGLLR